MTSRLSPVSSSLTYPNGCGQGELAGDNCDVTVSYVHGSACQVLRHDCHPFQFPVSTHPLAFVFYYYLLIVNMVHRTDSPNTNVVFGISID